MPGGSSLAALWLANPWLCWGVGSILSSTAGFVLVAALLELLLASGLADNRLIVYASTGDAPRKQLIAATQARIPWWKQVRGCARILVGPRAAVNGAAISLLMMLVQPAVGGWLPEGGWAAAGLQLLALALLADFGLYWGHRVQHESELLWRWHKLHHSIDTPTPASTLYIHPVDAALQGSIPLALAAAAVRPAPGVLYCFLAARIGENALNHSGIDSVLLDALTLKLLPLRAPASFHDAHHKYSNHARRARNYGESFWLWDWIFGTLSPLSGRAAADAHPGGGGAKQAAAACGKAA